MKFISVARHYNEVIAFTIALTERNSLLIANIAITPVAEMIIKQECLFQEYLTIIYKQKPMTIC